MSGKSERADETEDTLRGSHLSSFLVLSERATTAGILPSAWPAGTLRIQWQGPVDMLDLEGRRSCVQIRPMADKSLE